MKEYTTENLRNVALISHGSAGKTMLAEAMLFVTGATTRMGKIEDGTTVSDYDDEEIRRKISLSTSVLPVEVRDHKVNVLDAPGFTDFVGEMVSALSVADGAVLLLDAVSGMEVGTEIAWGHADQFHLPRFIVINKLDRDNANFATAYASAEEFARAGEHRLVKVQLPIGEKHEFKGVVDLISMKAYMGDGKAASEIPAEMMAAAKRGTRSTSGGGRRRRGHAAGEVSGGRIALGRRTDPRPAEECSVGLVHSGLLRRRRSI